MGAKPRKNAKTARKLNNENLKHITEVLFLFGKPLYKIFYFLIFTVFFIISLLGRNSRIILRETGQLFQEILSLLNYRLLFITKGYKNRYKKGKATKARYFIQGIQLKVLNKFSTKTGLLVARLRLKLLRAFSINLPHPRVPKVKGIFLFLTGLLFFMSLTFWLVVLKDLPSPQDLINREQEVSTKIYDRNGKVLFNIYKDQNRSPIPLSEIPLHVRLATLAAEDAEFYSHPGFSPRGITRAFIKNIGSGQLSGGSTITQQLVKNALLTPEKTLTRKLKEVVLSVRVEIAFTKDEILEMYLNEVSYGGTAYGIQEASRVFFDKDTNDLSISEAALLAGLPKSPTKFSPFGPNPGSAVTRQQEVLRLMKINKFINKEQQEQAANQDVTFAINKTEILAPHFVMFVKQALVEQYGEEVVEKGGLEVITTLDYSIQQLAEAAVEREIGKLASLNVTNAAVIVMDPINGDILAMVGSKNYFDTQADGNVNVTTRPRQPGSSIKVINYAYALSNGMTPATILADTPITFSVEGQPPYSPRNYDNTFRGNLSLRSAFAESRNVPAVKVLEKNGVLNMIELGRSMGITSWLDPNNYGLSLTLGGGEVKLIDLATIYATVANKGKRPKITSVKKVTNYKGKILEENNCESQKNKFKIASVEASQASLELSMNSKVDCGEQVLDPRVAFMLTDILKDNTARSPAFGTRSTLVIPKHREVAVKTGTSNDLRDNLTVGYNQNYLVAVWVGNNDNSPMARVASGITGASPIWNNIMSSLLANQSNHDWEVPEGLVQLPICTITGTLTCKDCPTRQEWFLAESQPTQHCSSKHIKNILEDKILPSAASDER